VHGFAGALGRRPASKRRSGLMIEFRNVSKAYRSAKASKVILDNFTGEIPRGRNIGLLGVNGAGKSTVLRLIAGTEYVDSGTIRRRVKVSFPLGFSGSFVGALSGRENCRFIARIYGVEVRRVERFVEEFAEIGRYFDMPVVSYSSGMKARVALGVSMAIDFECYLVDETLAVGDATFKARCSAVFDAKRKRASMILVSHSPGMMRRYCDMGAVLSNGELHFFNDLEDAIKEHHRICGESGFDDD
jgi:capsular polysaccharide transport system ATP-binding protein